MLQTSTNTTLERVTITASLSRFVPGTGAGWSWWNSGRTATICRRIPGCAAEKHPNAVCFWLRNRRMNRGSSHMKGWNQWETMNLSGKSTAYEGVRAPAFSANCMAATRRVLRIGTTGARARLAVASFGDHHFWLPRFDPIGLWIL